MYIDLKKTLEEISRCLPEKGVPTSKQLQRMYELTLRLQSQELAVIYDMEAFGSPAAQEQRPLAQQHSGGENRNGVVTLKIGEPLPAMKRLLVIRHTEHGKITRREMSSRKSLLDIM